MQHLVNIPPFADPASIVALAVDAEAAGWDGVFLWDHLRWVPAFELDVYDPWVLLGAIATRTQRVRLGTLVTPLARRRPWIVAKEVVTLDHLSGGRAVLGVGLGEPVGADFADLGDPDDPVVRAAVLDESLAIIDAVLGGEPVDHDGEHFAVRTELRPAARQQPRVPIWVAALVPNRRPLRRARRWDGLAPIARDGDLSPDALARYLASDGEQRSSGWDVVAPRAPGVPVQEYADAGATWLSESTWPVGDWWEEFAARVRAGPSRD